MQEQKTTNGTALATRNEGAIARRNPWSEMNELRQRMDDLFSRAFGYTPLSNLLPSDWKEAEPDVEIHETPEEFQVLASLPGYAPNQIQIEATENSILIRGERPALVDKEKEKTTTHRDTGLSGSSQFQFAYTLPTEINPNRIQATFENGMLRLKMPKTEQARAKSVKVAIQGAK